MKKKSCYSIGLITIVLALLLVVCYALKPEADNNSLFSLIVATEKSTETIIPWQDENGDFYVFLPSYTQMKSAAFSAVDGNQVYIEGNCIKNGTSCEGYAHNIPYSLEYRLRGETYKRQITFMKSENVPTIYIDTTSGSMKYIHAQKGNEETGEMRIYVPGERSNYTGVIEAINGRGNSTWDDFDKKPYNLKLKNEANLLGMGTAQKWILLANAYDPSHMRNKISYDFADELGLKYSPDSQWVDLYLNGEYAGLYLLCERNEVHEERVAIPEEGSFLLSVEREARLQENDRQYILTNAGLALRTHYADADVDLAGKIQSVENAILSEEGIDSITGKSWTELIDVESWARKYLMEEFFANTDGGVLSQFYYLDGSDSSGKLYAGPVWDFDASQGAEVSWQIPATDAFYANRALVREGGEITWFYSLYQKEAFLERVKQIYETEFLPLLQRLFAERIGIYAAAINESAQMDTLRWNTGKDFTTEVESLITFLTARERFLSELWLGEKSYHLVSIYPGDVLHHLYCPVEHGLLLMPLPQLTNTEHQTFLGWYYVDTDLPFDSTVPITEDIEIYAKWEDSQQKRVGQIVKLMPLAIIACMGVCVLCADIRRSRKGG